jgi:signal transduction histidine kinase
VSIDHSGTPLRRRVLVSILAVTALAVLAFALPLGIAVQRLYRSETVTALQQEATRVAAVVPDTMAGSAVSVPRVTFPKASVGVYDTTGRRVAGSGPGQSALAAGGSRQVRNAVEGVDLAVFVPIPSDQRAAGAVRASVPYSVLTGRVYQAWAVMVLLACGAMGLAGVLARRQAIRLARPLEHLTSAARALGDGDFTVRAERSGMLEADIAGRALQDTAVRLGQLVERGRTFSSDVSHQLRTPITALMTGLESALTRPDADPRAALRDALSRTEHLHTIVEDLISLTRLPGFAAVPVDLGWLLGDVRERWAGPFAGRGRRLDLAAGQPVPRCVAAEAAVRQILDVLIGNALWHGAGTVTVTAERAGAEHSGADVAVEVCDEGAGFPAGLLETPEPERADGHGRGLPLARSLAAAAGGSLTVPRAAPHPVFRLLLPGEGQPVSRR